MDNTSYIKYEIVGISGINLKENYIYKVDNKVIDSVLISKELKDITLYLKKNKLNKNLIMSMKSMSS